MPRVKPGQTHSTQPKAATDIQVSQPKRYDGSNNGSEYFASILDTRFVLFRKNLEPAVLTLTLQRTASPNKVSTSRDAQTK